MKVRKKYLHVVIVIKNLIHIKEHNFMKMFIAKINQLKKQKKINVLDVGVLDIMQLIVMQIVILMEI